MGKVGIRDDKFKLRPDSELYIACEDFDLSFFREEVEQVKQGYEQGVPVLDIAEDMERHEVEIAILLIDLAEKGEITPRHSGVF